MSTDITHSRSSMEGKTATATRDDTLADQEHKAEKGGKLADNAKSDDNAAVDEVNGEKGERDLGDEEKGKDSSAPAAQSEILTGRRLVVVWSAFLLSVLLVALDNTIVSTALPKLASHFNALNQLTWIVSGYLLTQAGFILIYGQILTIIPTKWVYLFVIFIFEVGSLICGVAPSMNVLILGRAIAGAGAAGIFTSILTVLSYATKLEQRPLLFGSFGAVFSFASVVGPLLGGAFTDKVSWRWCFYINLPLGALSIAAIAFLLPSRPVTPNPLYDGKTTLQKWLSLDVVGGLLSLAFITTLLLPLQWGGNTKAWSDPVVIGLLATCGALIIIFVLWEWYMGDYAIVPLYYFKRRSQTGATIEIFFIFFAFLLGAIYLPFLYQAKGRTAVQSGIDVIPFSMATILGTAISGGVIRATGHYKHWLIGAPWFAAIAGGLLFTIDTHTSNAKLIGYQIILGFGCGASFQNTLISIQAEYALEPEKIPQSTAITNFGQLTGGTIGVSIGGTIFGNYLTKYLGPLAGELEAYHPGTVQTVKQSVIIVFSLPEEIRKPVIEAYVHALATMFLVVTPILFLAGLFGFMIKDWNLKKRGDGAIKAAAA